jgi:hypothetical protein
MTPEPMTERAYILVRNLSALKAAQDAIRSIQAGGDAEQYGISIKQVQAINAVLFDATQRIFDIINTTPEEN